VQILVILVPVLFGLIGFAIDLGVMYVVKGELKTAANSMALAAAQQLIGTDVATDAASAAAQLTVQNGANVGNKYDFNGLPIGQTTNNLASTAPPPAYFAAAADAIAASANGGVGAVGGSQAKYAVSTITGQVPLVFWNFLPIVTSRNIAIVATAVAGISAPLCTACGIEPFAVAAIDPTDTTNLGYTLNELYSFTYLCTGTPVPAPLAGAAQVLSYVLLNRLDPNAVTFPDEGSQSFRDAAGGLPGNTNSAVACFTINNTELIWVNAAPVACSAAAPAPVVTDALCGLDSRFEVSTIVDARLADGSRMCAVIPPLSLIGPVLSIRRFGKKLLTTDDLLKNESLTPGMLDFLSGCVEARLNIVVSGGSGSGKTTMLNTLSALSPKPSA